MINLNPFLYLYKITILALIFLLPTSSLAAPININQADIPTITENLTDVGPVKATAIVQYRELNGPFKRAEDLLSVKGIGKKTLEKNRDNLLFDDQPKESLQEPSTEE